MESVIETLESALKLLKAEVRVFSTPPNESASTVLDIKGEIKEHKKALKILKKRL